MKMFLPFGDWSQDGHGRACNILIEAPSMNHLLQAEIKIKDKYGKFFFENYAQSYDSPYFCDENWQALIDTKYPIERVREHEDCNDWNDVNSLAEFISEIDCNPSVSLGFVIDSFIWLLNAFGAEIRICDQTETIPTICNWSCPGFQTVGYGCSEFEW